MNRIGDLFRPSPVSLAIARGTASGDLHRLVRNLWLFAAISMLIVGAALGQRVPAAAGALALLTGAAAMAWSRVALVRVEFQRHWSSQRAFVGDEIEATFTLRNRKALPLPWVELRELVSDRLRPAGARLLPAPWQGGLYYTHITSLSWYERVTWRQRFVCTARGYFRVGPSELRSSDVFGFFGRRLEFAAQDAIIVMPRLVDLPDLTLPARRPFGDARRGSQLFEDQSRMAGLRDYQPGDPLKRIDWNATARRGALQSRLYEPSSTTSLIVALNVDTFTHPWEGHDPLLLERAVSVAATIARLAESQRVTTGLLANCSYPGADRPIIVPPSRDPVQLTRIFTALATVAPFTIISLDELLARERRYLPLTASVAIVAGFMTAPLAERLEHMQREGIALAIYWVSDEPMDPGYSGIIVHNLASRLRDYERSDALAYGGDTAEATRSVRRAI